MLCCCKDERRLGRGGAPYLLWRPVPQKGERLKIAVRLAGPKGRRAENRYYSSAGYVLGRGCVSLCERFSGRMAAWCWAQSQPHDCGSLSAVYDQDRVAANQSTGAAGVSINKPLLQDVQTCSRVCSAAVNNSPPEYREVGVRRNFPQPVIDKATAANFGQQTTWKAAMTTKTQNGTERVPRGRSWWAARRLILTANPWTWQGSVGCSQLPCVCYVPAMH